MTDAAKAVLEDMVRRMVAEQATKMFHVLDPVTRAALAAPPAPFEIDVLPPATPGLSYADFLDASWASRSFKQQYLADYRNTTGPPPKTPTKAGSAIDPVGLTSPPRYSVDPVPGTGPPVWLDYPLPLVPPPDPAAAAFLRAIMPPLADPPPPPPRSSVAAANAADVVDSDTLAVAPYQDHVPADGEDPVFLADKVAEIAFPAPLAAEDAAAVETYLARRYGVVECPP